MKLEDIVQDALPTGSVVLRGTTYPIRCVTAAERERLEAVVVRPAPVMRKNTDKGSLAPEVLDEDATDALWRERDRRLRLVEVAVAIGLETPDEGAFDVTRPDDELRAWAAAGVDAWLGALGVGEFDRIYGAYATLRETVRTDLGKDSGGSSSAPRPADTDQPSSHSATATR